MKLLNEEGEFLSDADGREVLALAAAEDFDYVTYDLLGKERYDGSLTEKHIRAVLDMPLTDCDAIREAGFTVVVDAVNSVGGVVIPALLKALGVRDVTELYCEPTGLFPHNPEPLPEHLADISRVVGRVALTLDSLLILMLTGLRLSVRMVQCSGKNIHW